MADDDQVEAGPSRTQVAAGGVVGGAGLSTALFSTIGMGKIFASPAGYSTAYPVVVFCLAALFLLTAALMTVRITREQRLLAYAGMGCFALVMVAGVSIIFWQDFRAPTVTITEMFEPSDLMGDSSSSPRLQLLYRPTRGTVTDYAPYRNSPLAIRSGDVLAFRMDGLSNLVEDDKAIRTQSQIQTRMLLNACKGYAANPVCQQIAGLDAPGP